MPCKNFITELHRAAQPHTSVASRNTSPKKIFAMHRFFLTVNFLETIPSLAATYQLQGRRLIIGRIDNGNEEGSCKEARKKSSKKGNQEINPTQANAERGTQSAPPVLRLLPLFCGATVLQAAEHSSESTSIPTPCSCRSRSPPVHTTLDPCPCRTALAHPAPCPSSRCSGHPR